MSDEAQDELLPAEDWPTFFTQVPVWLTLSDIPAQSLRAYAFLAEHLNNREPGRRTACPKQTAIARVLGLKKRQHVPQYIDALVRVGAVEVQEYRYQNGMRRGKRYILRFNPPPGFTGPRSLSDFYELNPDVRSAAAPGRTAGGIGADQKGSPRSTRNKTAGRAGGTKNGTSRGAEKGTSRGAEKGAPELDQENQDQLETAAAVDLVPHQREGEAVENPAAAGPDDEVMAEARRLLTALLPPEWRQNPVQTAEAAPLVAERLRRGWTAEGLCHGITTRPEGLQRPAAAVLTRLRLLPLNPPRKVATKAVEPPVAPVAPVTPADSERKAAAAARIRAEIQAVQAGGKAADAEVVTCLWCEHPNHPGFFEDSDGELQVCDHADEYAAN